MKKCLSIILIFALFGFVGCGDINQDTKQEVKKERKLYIPPNGIETRKER